MYYRIVILGIIAIFNFTARASEVPVIFNMSVDKSYAPVGFDDNDNVQLTVAGIFPSTCYKVAGARAVVDQNKRAIHIWQRAYFYNGICLRMVVPFTQTVDLGLVASGDYNIYDGPSRKFLGKLPITRSTHSGPDDYLYAPVHDAFLVAHEHGIKTLTLLGEFSDRCTGLQEIKVQYYPEVIVVQPIARRTAEKCDEKKTPFIETVELASSLEGTHLLHVRSMNGQAINKLVNASYVKYP